MLMKSILINPLSGLFLLCGLLASCSQEDTPLPVDSVPLEIQAAGDALVSASTRAGGLLEEAFDAALVMTTRQGEYSGFAGKYEGCRDATVNKDGTVVWKLSDADTAPEYPETGDWLYLVGVSPAAVPADGKVVYQLTGSEDLLYAGQQRGNKWDRDRFSGNTDPTRDKPLEFNHLLTRLRFKARKREADGQAVTVTEVKVNQAYRQATVALASGTPVFDGDQGLSLHPDGGGKEVPADCSTVSLGELFLPPLQERAAYTLDVKTSAGNFSSVPISFNNDVPGAKFQAGMSHEVTLSVSDTNLDILSITAIPWESVEIDDDLIIKD